MAQWPTMPGVAAGATILNTARSPLAWGAPQPATESVVAALAGGDYDTGLDLDALVEAKTDLERLKNKYSDYLSTAADRVDSDILRYQVPGLMLEDVNHQLQQHGAGERQQEVLAEIRRVRQEVG